VKFLLFQIHAWVKDMMLIAGGFMQIIAKQDLEKAVFPARKSSVICTHCNIYCI